MPSRDHQGEKRKFQTRKVEKNCRHVPQNVVDPYEGEVENIGQRFGGGDADQEGAHQSRPLGNGDSFDIFQADFGLG